MDGNIILSEDKTRDTKLGLDMNRAILQPTNNKKAGKTEFVLQAYKIDMLFLAVFVVINLNDSTYAYTHQKYPLPNNATKVGISRGETPL